ncbi:MAG: zf-HC2 domain-containing protein [Acidimicrobiia bacterium]
MSDCDQALANLYLYLDAELDQASAMKVKTHLEACNGCDAPFDFERRLREVIRNRLGEEIPEVFVLRLRTLLAHETSGAG